MHRIKIEPRDNWKQLAEEVGFRFHTLDGAPYWDETACYRFTLKQIEDDIEDPSAEIEQMCFEVVDRCVKDESLLQKLDIPEPFWDMIATSWRERHKNLYGRLDFAYDGHGPAKLLEYNADTPTTLYESAAFQWVWLEDAMAKGLIPPDCDQYNSIHECLITAFHGFDLDHILHMAACRGSAEDEGTVLYLEECAVQAGLETRFIHMEELGIDADARLSDMEDTVIETLFKLYPWEWMMREEFGQDLPKSPTRFIEPVWKVILSCKGTMALLWDSFPGHDNLLESYFLDDKAASNLSSDYVIKPLYSREGANVSLYRAGQKIDEKSGPYSGGSSIIQAYHGLGNFDGNYPVLGSWLVASKPAGLGIREDKDPITTDGSRFIPHVIRD